MQEAQRGRHRGGVRGPLNALSGDVIVKDSFSDILVLNLLCLERGGVEAFMRWTSTSDGLGECIGDFQDLRSSILMGHREMLVHRNEAEALSYALAGGIPHFD